MTSIGLITLILLISGAVTVALAKVILQVVLLLAQLLRRHGILAEAEPSPSGSTRR